MLSTHLSLPIISLSHPSSLSNSQSPIPKQQILESVHIPSIRPNPPCIPLTDKHACMHTLYTSTTPHSITTLSIPYLSPLRSYSPSQLLISTSHIPYPTPLFTSFPAFPPQSPSHAHPSIHTYMHPKLPPEI